MEILVSICARGGSKGVPGKNIKPIAGLPLIAYTIKTAQKFMESCPYNTTLALSTDSPAIKAAAAEYGLTTNYVRPEYLATDKAGKLDVWKDLVLYEEKKQNKRFDYHLDLDVTSPLRTVEDLLRGFDKLHSNEKALNLFSVSPAHRNPYFCVVEEDKDGFVHLVKSLGHNVLSRQSAPAVYDMNGSFYYQKRRCYDMPDFYTINQYSLAYLMPHICFDIDSPIDFDFMEFVITQQKFKFDF